MHVLVFSNKNNRLNSVKPLTPKRSFVTWPKNYKKEEEKVKFSFLCGVHLE